MKIFNSLTGRVETFVPIQKGIVGMYACGPTVYDFTHIGHGRKYVGDDILRRTLLSLGYEVKLVENVTDVGHLSSDSDEGEDKMEKGAAKYGKTVWEVAEFYTDYFLKTVADLNIMMPTVLCKATDNIKEQIEMVSGLIAKGFAYETDEAVYFEVAKFSDYSKMFGQKLEDKKVGARESVNIDENKKDPADFALWFKRVGRFAQHTMHWPSPWGDGFPGWHIECSAMSIKYLGEQFDIHTGGEDHKPIHHPNEIAQSEAYTGKTPFVKYWVHHSFLRVMGKKMSKSLNNFLRVEDVVKQGYDPIALRYLYLTTHYRKPLNFTYEGLNAAQKALSKLRDLMVRYKSSSERTQLSEEKLAKLDSFRAEFKSALDDDLNTPKALAVVWSVVASNIPDYDKYDLIVSFDEVLGFGLGNWVGGERVEVPKEVLDLFEKREEMRTNRNYAQADLLRHEIEAHGFKVEDGSSGAKLVKGDKTAKAT